MRWRLQSQTVGTVIVSAVCTASLATLVGCATSQSSCGPCACGAARKTDVPTLQSRLDARKAEFVATAPPELVQTFEEGVETVRQSGIIRRALRVGDQAADFRLSDPNGHMLALHELRADGPVVLIWYRGGWCPYCNLQLRAYQEVLGQIRALGGQLVAISPELPGKARETAVADELDYIVLSDVGNKVARRWGLVYTLPAPVASAFQGRVDLNAYNGDTSNELPLAATYVVDRDGFIRYAFVSADYRERAEPAEVLAALRTLE